MSKTIMTVGTFDILHIDHLNLFKQCREIVGPEGQLLVGVNSDSFVQGHKGIKPSMSQNDRLLLVNAIEYVDVAFWNTEPSLDHAMMAYSPDYLAIGSDWFRPGKDYMAQIGLSWGEMWEYNCMVVIVPSLERMHSSDFRKELS